MTLFVCQCLHNGRAKVWAVESEAELFDLCGVDGVEFADPREAVRYDVRDAYVTDDVVDLWLWIEGTKAPRASGAAQAFLDTYATRGAIEALATQGEGADGGMIYTALDGAFTWSVDDDEWTLGNQPPVEASGLAAALGAALVARALDTMEEEDV